jgi:ATP-dependent protease ClpP protease subunit
MRNLQEWYMTAQEAVSFGFADGILGKDFSIESHV